MLTYKAFKFPIWFCIEKKLKRLSYPCLKNVVIVDDDKLVLYLKQTES